MASTPAAESIATLADLLDRLGGIPPNRVRCQPSPGTASESDVLEVQRNANRLCELVDGVLVEKAMGFRESILAIALATYLREFILPRNLGVVAGADGLVRLSSGLVRIPDVAFVSWNRLPDGRLPTTPIPDIVPDLAVEVLSQANTEAEMNRKLGEYFSAGVRLVWLVDPDRRNVIIYTSPNTAETLGAAQTLTGGKVLPEFAIDLQKLFAELDRHGVAD